MPDYRRFYIPNSIVFITAVTLKRRHYLQNDNDIGLFWNTLKAVQGLHPFHLLSYVILPDHFHWLMNVDNPDGNYSVILKSLKWNFTREYKKSHGISSQFNVWQRGFWDHIIRDEQDLKNHFDYIHWNPIKHAYVKSPELWKHSTYSFWMDRGYYSPNAQSIGLPKNITSMDFE